MALFDHRFWTYCYHPKSLHRPGFLVLDITESTDIEPLPYSIKALKKAVIVINKISIIDIRAHLQSEQIDANKVKKRFNIKSILKKHKKFKNFVSLLKHLYGKVMRLSVSRNVNLAIN